MQKVWIETETEKIHLIQYKALVFAVLKDARKKLIKENYIEVDVLFRSLFYQRNVL